MISLSLSLHTRSTVGVVLKVLLAALRRLSIWSLCMDIKRESISWVQFTDGKNLPFRFMLLLLTAAATCQTVQVGEILRFVCDKFQLILLKISVILGIRMEKKKHISIEKGTKNRTPATQKLLTQLTCIRHLVCAECVSWRKLCA